MQDDPDRPLWRGAQLFRFATVLYAIAVQATAYQSYDRPGLSWVLIALLVMVSGVFGIAYLIRPNKAPVAAVEVVVVTAFILSSRLVAPPEWWMEHQSLPTTIWVVNAIISVALLYGPIAGTAIAVWFGGLNLWIAQSLSELWQEARTPVMITVGLVIGVLARSARRANEQLAAATRLRAATAERERIGREVHDGVLQVLALIKRRGPDEPLGELAGMAGEQERALRELLADQGSTQQQPGDTTNSATDLRTSLREILTAETELAAPADPVWLEAHAAAELQAVVRAALHNSALHAGENARTWVLIEDLTDSVVVTVRDDGAGMSPERASQAGSDGRMGISQSIRGRITDLGGTAELITAPGEGVEWELTVPKPQ